MLIITFLLRFIARIMSDATTAVTMPPLYVKTYKNNSIHHQTKKAATRYISKSTVKSIGTTVLPYPEMQTGDFMIEIATSY